MEKIKAQLSMHRDSHTISKLKPKIRIIHIVAPEIIKTDVENFRNLVQRLTGKSADQKAKGRIKKARRVLPQKGMIRSTSTNCTKLLWTNIVQQPNQAHQGIQFLQDAQRMKKEIKSSSTSHEIFGGFGDADINFVQDLTQFPLIPFKTSQSQINKMFGEMPLC
ncbi:hypothetical protein ACH5RR_023515 [Cinchona calisaya]|uniref:VQ domain-containing protein n=1 Tax=Cinchona calisaya TaxID=153742 RepID=A0ABD2ZAY1_9GENT